MAWRRACASFCSYAVVVRSLRVCFFTSLACGVSAAALSLVACVGDDPATGGATTPYSDASRMTPPGVDASTSDTRSPDSPDAADAGGDAAPKRYCQTQAPLTGVTDFFCADFDGTKGEEGFTSASIPDGGGALMLVTDQFVSAPNALVTKGEATVTYTKTGATPFLEFDLD